MGLGDTTLKIYFMGTVSTWRSEDNFWESVSSLSTMWIELRLSGLVGKHLYQKSIVLA